MMVRSALVTGASRGIGFEVARRLASEGYALTVAARREGGLLEAAGQLRAEASVDVHPVAANLGGEGDVERLIGEHATRYGSLDLLVLNAGVAAMGDVADLPTKTYDLVLNVNLRAQFLLIQHTLPLLRKAAEQNTGRGAKIVALASITGLASEPGLSAYAASKAGLISLCETVTLEESARGVTATAISPGYVDTDMTVLVRDTLDAASMLQAADVVELVLAVSRLSAGAVVPNIVLTRAGSQIWRA